jgi:hypothetical protein
LPDAAAAHRTTSFRKSFKAPEDLAMALSAAAQYAVVGAAISISGASIGHRFAGWKPEHMDKAVGQYAGRANPVDLLPLAGASANALGGEVFDHPNEWDFLKLAPALGKRLFC